MAPKVDKSKVAAKAGMSQEEKLDYLIKKIERLDNIEEKLTSIEKTVERVTALEKDIKEVKEEQEEQKASLQYTQHDVDMLQEETKDIKSTLDQHNDIITSMQGTINMLAIDRARMTHEMTKQEDYSKRECLLFEGIPEQKDLNCTDKIMSIINNQLEIKHDIKLQRCHRLGPYDNKRIRAIIVKFLWFQDRQSVMKNAKKLKGSNIWIQEYFSAPTTNRRKALVPLMRHAQKNKNQKCSLIGDVLYVNGNRYTIETANQVDFCQESVTRQNDTVLAFAGQLSYLSNFYTCKITIDGKDYTSVEQYFQYSKAIYSYNTELAMKICCTSDPVAQKQLGGRLKKSDADWDSGPVMTKAVRAKFEQHSTLMEYLKNTEGHTLVHANAHDNYWANGLGINNKDVLNQQKWNGTNKLGNILAAIRSE
jgi:hypothetical protein